MTATVPEPASQPARQPSAVWKAFAWALVIWLVMLWFDLRLRNVVAPAGIVSLELAFTNARFEAIVQSWDASARQAAWGSLLVDFAFMFAYGRWLSMWVRSVGETLRSASPVVSRWAGTFAAMVWVAVLLDVLENLGLGTALLVEPGARTAAIVTAGICATIKFLLLIAGVFYVVNGTVAERMSRSHGP